MSTWDMIDRQNKVLTPFYKQVDATRKRLNLTPYKMTDPLSGKELKDVINVTENLSATYMTRIIAGLMSSKWQTVVEGEISSREAHKIEKFVDTNFQQTDEYLFNTYGMAGLDTWLCNHVCHTSLIGVEWMCRVEDGEYKIHCLPYDMRYTPFVLNKWVAPVTWRTKDELLQELEEFEKLAKDDLTGDLKYALNKDAEGFTKEELEVRNYWDEKKNELWVEKQLVFSQPNTYGELPSVIVWVPSGFMFRDKGHLAHESPSLLFLNELLYDQKSRQLSIDASLAFNALQPAHEYETNNPTGLKSRPAPKRGESLAVPVGELHKPVPTTDINQAELASRDQTDSLIEAGGPISPRAYTTPPSAIEVVTEVELLNQLQNPQIIALQTFKASLTRLMIEQFQTIGEGSVSIGRLGEQSIFGVEQLKDPKKYVVNFQLMKQNKRLAIVNRAEALSAWGRFPTLYIVRDILGVEDVDGWMREIDLEKAKAANPGIGLAEMAVRYAEEAEDMEGDDKDFKNWQSMMLVHQYVIIMRQMMMPQQPAEVQNTREATKQTGNSNTLVSLLGPGKGAL